MTEYRFTLFVPTPIHTHNQLLEVTESLKAAGLNGASIFGHKEGFEIIYKRSAESLQSAVAFAVAQVKNAGYTISGVEFNRETVMNN